MSGNYRIHGGDRERRDASPPSSLTFLARFRRRGGRSALEEKISYLEVLQTLCHWFEVVGAVLVLSWPRSAAKLWRMQLTRDHCASGLADVDELRIRLDDTCSIRCLRLTYFFSPHCSGTKWMDRPETSTDPAYGESNVIESADISEGQQ